MGWTSMIRFPAGKMMGFSLLATAVFSLALGPTQSPTQWVQGAVSPGGKAAGP